MKHYDAIYLTQDRLVLSYTASVVPYARCAILKPESYTTPAWTTRSLSTLDVDSIDRYKEIQRDEVHLSRLPIDVVADTEPVHIIEDENPWNFDCSKMNSSDEVLAISRKNHLPPLYVCMHSRDGQRKLLRFVDPEVSGYHWWGIPTSIVLLPIGFAMDIVTFPFQLHWLSTHQ